MLQHKPSKNTQQLRRPWTRPLKGTAGANRQRESESSIGYIVIELSILGGFRFVQRQGSDRVLLYLSVINQQIRCSLSTQHIPPPPFYNVRQLIIPSPILKIFSVTF